LIQPSCQTPAFVTAPRAFQGNKRLHRALRGLRYIRPIVTPMLNDNLRKRIERLASKINNKNLAKPPLSCELRCKMISTCKSDIAQLQDLIGRDLSHWLT
jgi:hypothetical protein